MGVGVSFKMRSAIYFDERNVERRCVIVVSGDRILFGYDPDRRGLIPDPKSAIQVIPQD